jgi:hypothetical protein
MTGRVDPFAVLKEPTSFPTKPKQEKRVEESAIERIAEQNNFPSRQAPKAPAQPRRKPRRYKTGRNQQLNIKATGETIERFLKAADAESVPLGEMLKRALDVFEAGKPQKNP